MTTMTLIATPDDIPAEILERMLRARVQFDALRAQFDALRPTCPKDWCDGSCDDDGHFGDAILHVSDQASIPSVPDQKGAEPGRVTVHAWRHDCMTEPSTVGVELRVTDSKSECGDQATFTAQQARHLAAELLRCADRIDPALSAEVDVPAPDVRIGDRLQVAGEWLHVYGVCADEPSFTVQIFTTVDPSEWPELNGDEDASMFKLTESVRVRRTLAGGAR